MSSLQQVVLAIRPWDHEQDINLLTDRINGISLDGITWGASHASDIGYGVKELHIAAACDTAVTSIDTLLELIIAMEDAVSQASVTLWNKV